MHLLLSRPYSGFATEPEVEVSGLWNRTSRAVQTDRNVVGHDPLAARIDLIEPFEKGLASRLWKRLQGSPADKLAIAGQAHISLVGELEHMLGPAQDGGESGRLLEQAPLPLDLGRKPLLGHHLAGDLGTQAGEPGDGPGLITHGCIGERKVRFLRVAPPLQNEGKIVDMNRLARISAFDERQEIVADLGPCLQDRSAQGGGMLPCKDLGKAIVVEQCALATPDDVHGLLEAQHDPDKRLELSRPSGGASERRCRPPVGPHEGAHRSAREEVLPFA